MRRKETQKKLSRWPQRFYFWENGIVLNFNWKRERRSFLEDFHLFTMRYCFMHDFPRRCTAVLINWWKYKKFISWKILKRDFLTDERKKICEACRFYRHLINPRVCISVITDPPLNLSIAKSNFTFFVLINKLKSNFMKKNVVRDGATHKEKFLIYIKSQNAFRHFFICLHFHPMRNSKS